MEDLYTPDEKKLLECLLTKDSYKKNVKPYIQSVQKQKTQNMHLIADTVRKLISNKTKEVPMAHLHAIRLIKESIETQVQEMRDIVAEKVLPQMTSIAQFQKNIQNDDRGKTYFCEQPSQEQQQVGNSFFRLILECIQVWGQNYENTEFQKSFNYLKSQSVKFPDSLYYFKTEELKNSKVSKNNPNDEQQQVSQVVQSSTRQQKPQEYSQIEQQNKQQKDQQAELLEQADSQLNELQNAKQQLVQIFNNRQADYNGFEEASNKIHMFQQNSNKYIDQLSQISQEAKVAQFFSEGEFAQNYTNDYNSFSTLNKENRFNQLKQKYLPKLDQKSNLSAQNNQNNNYQQDENTIEKNSKYSKIQENQNNQYNSQNDRNILSNQINYQIKEDSKENLQGKSPVCDFLDSSEIDQYKVQVKSGTNFRKMSPNSSYYSQQSVGTSKTALLRKSNRPQQQQFSQTGANFYQSGDKNQSESSNSEINRLKQIIDDLIRDRDQWKNKYDEQNRQVEQQNQKIQELELLLASYQ